MPLSNFLSECQKITCAIDKMDGQVIADGVINPERYLKAKYRILWILKEANSSDCGERWSIVDSYKNPEWLKDKALGNPTLRRIIYASYGILRSNGKSWKEFPFANKSECYDVLQEIALVNIKKAAGKSKADDAEIRDAYRSGIRHISNFPMKSM